MKIASAIASALYLGAKHPWILLFSGARTISQGFRWFRWLRVVLGRPWRADTLDCAAGHANPLLGRWRCACGFELLGHAFAACPSCGEEAGWFPCRTCGLGIKDPLRR